MKDWGIQKIKFKSHGLAYMELQHKCHEDNDFRGIGRWFGKKWRCNVCGEIAPQVIEDIAFLADCERYLFQPFGPPQ